MESSGRCREELLGCRSPLEVRELSIDELQKRYRILPDAQQPHVFVYVFEIFPKYFEHARIDSVFRDILIFLREFIMNTTYSAPFDGQCTIFDALGKLFGSLQENQRILLIERQHIVKWSLQIIADVYLICKERSFSSETSTQLSPDGAQAFHHLFESCQRLQSALIDFVGSKNMVYFSNDAQRLTEEVQLLGKVLSRFCDIARVIMDLSIRCASQIWTFVLKLSSYICEHRDVSPPSATKWLKRAINVLATHIQLEMETMLDKPDEEFERMLKIVSFYTKVMFRLACKFDGSYFRGHECYLNAFQIVLSCPKRDGVSTKRLAAIAVNVTKVFSDILAVVAFSKEFTSFLWTSTDPIRILVSCKLIEILIHDKSNSKLPSLYLENKTNNILELIAKQLRYCSNSQVDSFYNETVCMCATLMVILANDRPELVIHIERILSDGLLADDFLLGLFTLDVWCFWIRFLSPKQCHKYLHYWSVAEEGFGCALHRPGTIFVASLIRNLYDILSEHDKQMFVSAKSIASRDRLFIILGAIRLEDKHNSNRLITQARAQFDDILMKPTALNWYSLLRILNAMIALKNTEITGEVASQLTLLWSHMNVHNATVATSLLNLTTATVLSSFAHDQLLIIFTSLVRFIDHNVRPPTILRLYTVEFLQQIAKLKFTPNITIDLTRIAKLFQSLLTDDDPIVRAQCMVAYARVEHEQMMVDALQTPALKRDVNMFLKKTEAHCGDDIDAYDLANKSCTFTHICGADDRNVNNEYDRESTAETSVDIWDVINRVNEDVQFLVRLRTGHRLSSEQRLMIEAIPWRDIIGE